MPFSFILMKQEADNCTMEFNKTAKSILDSIKSVSSIFYGKGIQSIGSGILGWIFWVMAFIILFSEFSISLTINSAKSFT